MGIHPHKTTSNRKLLRRRRARQAWKNYAALEGLKLVIENDMVYLYSSRDGVIRRSTAINVSMSPVRVIENPKLLAWILDVDTTVAALASDINTDKIRQRIDSELIQTLLSGDRHRRASRAK